MAATVQVVGSGLIKFEFLVQRLGSREAARDAFEQLVEDVVSLVHPDVHSVKANPGDWGIDAFVGELTRGGEVFVWQAKYFIDGFGKTQQQDIRDSYASAMKAAETNGYKLRSWTLCLPCTLDAPNLKWWQGWVKRNSKDGVIKSLWDEGELRRRLLSDAGTDLRNGYFAPVFVLDGEPAEGGTRALADLEDETRYDDTLFVRQMHAAELMETSQAREAFFNAEILTQEIEDKGVPAEIERLRNWRLRVRATWSHHYNDAAQRESGDQFPGLYKGVMDDIEQKHAPESKALRASPIHGFGIMHQAVESQRAGWVRTWRAIAAEHAAPAPEWTSDVTVASGTASLDTEQGALVALGSSSAPSSRHFTDQSTEADNAV
ncbi:hypothetical protein [Diaminobutyricimonas sp. LJ205]|uniref:hypothetical protein n=1 Tax=Diaminobutyricimonas sp. LJ205 TaxID=2683590 RepID=UPI0012F479D9|nr:hypothetical protein [Diaminobutyricimonas sp. LJ205]